MPGSSFGQVFRVTTAGESHGPAEVVIVDGCPAGLELEPAHFELDMSRRRPGQSRLVSSRREPDRVEILSGVYEGRTTGAPIALSVRNEDARSRDYDPLVSVYRPGHADRAWDAKYGFRDPRGGGRASARETVARVAAAVVAKRLLARLADIEVLGWVSQVGDVRASVDAETVRLDDVESLPDGSPNPVRCPDPDASARMVDLIQAVRKERDSVGGVAEVVARGVPEGWGEPVFDKLRADLGKALFSLPAVMGVEFGSGFAAAKLRGSEHNDAFFRDEDGAIRTRGNRHGGMLGGISTGMPIVARAVVKPTSSIPQSQSTVRASDLEPTEVEVTGRHDPCLVPRFVVMAEAMVALTLADHGLRQRAARLG
jgi:chorismate synthase